MGGGVRPVRMLSSNPRTSTSASVAKRPTQSSSVVRSHTAVETCVGRRGAEQTASTPVTFCVTQDLVPSVLLLSPKHAPAEEPVSQCGVARPLPSTVTSSVAPPSTVPNTPVPRCATADCASLARYRSSRCATAVLCLGRYSVGRIKTALMAQVTSAVRKHVARCWTVRPTAVSRCATLGRASCAHAPPG